MVSPVRTVPPGCGAGLSTGKKKDTESEGCPGVATSLICAPAEEMTSLSRTTLDCRQHCSSTARTGAPKRSWKVSTAPVWSKWWWVTKINSTLRSPTTSATASACSAAPSWKPGSTMTTVCASGAPSTYVLVPLSVIPDGLFWVTRNVNWLLASVVEELIY